MPRPAADPRAGVAAVVLAGGRSRRFGRDKLAAEVDGRSLLDGVLGAAVRHAAVVVAVGPPRGTGSAGVHLVREEPAYAGPLAAVAAGVREVVALDASSALGVVLVLAGDLVDPEGALPVLLAALAAPTDGPAPDAAVLVDTAGHRQPLLAAYRLAPLATALGGREVVDRPARALLDGLGVVEVLDTGGWSHDVDTPDDLPR